MRLLIGMNVISKVPERMGELLHIKLYPTNLMGNIYKVI
jgi:hypothetical protein